ncbi:MAG: glycosyltransferase family 2 protein [Candidatus Binatia bacterium]
MILERNPVTLAPRPLERPRIVAIPVAFNEEHAIGAVVERLKEVDGIDVAVADDGSTDRTPAIITGHGVKLLRSPRQCGVGAAIRRAYEWAHSEGYDVCVILSGNDKDRPAEIPQLVAPIIDGRADIIQGSRYLENGRHENMPAHRIGASQVLHPWLFRLVAGQRITDTTNGFRALRLTMLDDPRLDLAQPWLDGYELEPYLLLRAIRLGYVVGEVPVTKVYPASRKGYTKMRPLVDWWRIVRPIVFVGVGLKQ